MGQQAVEELQVGNAKVSQGVVVDTDTATEPAEGVVVGAEVVKVASAADALQGGVQPQGDEQGRVGGWPAGMPLNGLDAVEQEGKVDALDELPDEARLVVVPE